MKARKPDGSRWFTPTPAELMDRWLDEPQLLAWLARTVEFRQRIDVEQLLIDALLEPVRDRMRVVACSDPRCPLCARLRSELQ